MVITAIGFSIMLYASYGLPSVSDLGGNAVVIIFAVSPYWLISTYFTLTIAELFLSPMGAIFCFQSSTNLNCVEPCKPAGYLLLLLENYLAGYIGRFYEN